jgi:hypothetical protein
VIDLTGRLASKKWMVYRQACAVQESMMLRSYALMGVMPPKATTPNYWADFKGKKN